MPYPVQALSRMRELAGAEGAVLVVDEAAEDTVEENANFIGHLFYNYSVLHCLPQAMGFPGTAATRHGDLALHVKAHRERSVPLL
jgi:hypothetical protein